MMWWQWLAIGYILGSAVTTLMVHITKDAPDDVAASEPEQRKMIDISILRHAEKVKQKMRGDR